MSKYILWKEADNPFGTVAYTDEDGKFVFFPTVEAAKRFAIANFDNPRGWHIDKVYDITEDILDNKSPEEILDKVEQTAYLDTDEKDVN